MSIEGLLGRKLGTGQHFGADGSARQVTVIDTGGNTVVQVKSVETDGYEAVQIGFGQRKNLNKPMKGHLQGLGEFQYLQEFAVTDIKEWEAGQKVGVDIFSVGDLVDVSGTTKGKGFAGVMKRHGFHGGPRTHGQSDRPRSPGSIGAGTDPGRVLKGRRMAGHMGTGQATVRNLAVIAADAERGILLVQGAVPGNNGSLMRVRFAGAAGEKRKQRAQRAIVG